MSSSLEMEDAIWCMLRPAFAFWVHAFRLNPTTLIELMEIKGAQHVQESDVVTRCPTALVHAFRIHQPLEPSL